MVEWALTDSGSTCPEWIFLKNKILISQVVLAFVSDFEPSTLLMADRDSMSFLKTLPSVPLRAIQGGTSSFSAAIERLLFCPKSKGRKTMATSTPPNPALSHDDVPSQRPSKKVKRISVQNQYIDSSDSTMNNISKEGVDFSRYLLPRDLMVELGFPLDAVKEKSFKIKYHQAQSILTTLKPPVQLRLKKNKQFFISDKIQASGIRLRDVSH